MVPFVRLPHIDTNKYVGSHQDNPSRQSIKTQDNPSRQSIKTIPEWSGDFEKLFGSFEKLLAIKPTLPLV